MEIKTADKGGPLYYSILLSGRTYSESARNFAQSADSVIYATPSAVTVTDYCIGCELFSLYHA